MARRLDLPPRLVREAATFYDQFHAEPHGRHLIRLCDNVTCHLAGAPDLLERLQAKLGIEPGQTTDDGRFTLEVVECLGACHQAPAVQIDGALLGPLEWDELEEHLDRLAADAEVEP